MNNSLPDVEVLRDFLSLYLDCTKLEFYCLLIQTPESLLSRLKRIDKELEEIPKEIKAKSDLSGKDLRALDKDSRLLLYNFERLSQDKVELTDDRYLETIQQYPALLDRLITGGTELQHWLSQDLRYKLILKKFRKKKICYPTMSQSKIGEAQPMPLEIIFIAFIAYSFLLWHDLQEDGASLYKQPPKQLVDSIITKAGELDGLLKQLEEYGNLSYNRHHKRFLDKIIRHEGMFGKSLYASKNSYVTINREHPKAIREIFVKQISVLYSHRFGRFKAATRNELNCISDSMGIRPVRYNNGNVKEPVFNHSGIHWSFTNESKEGHSLIHGDVLAELVGWITEDEDIDERQIYNLKKKQFDFLSENELDPSEAEKVILRKYRLDIGRKLKAMVEAFTDSK